MTLVDALATVPVIPRYRIRVGSLEELRTRYPSEAEVDPSAAALYGIPIYLDPELEAGLVALDTEILGRWVARTFRL